MPDLLTRACAQCHSDCKTCLGATDKNCTSCSDPLKVLHNQMCLSTCPTKFFKGENGMCVACHRTCQVIFALRPHFDSTSTLFRPRFDLVSTLFRPRFNSTSTPLRPHFDPTSALRAFWSRELVRLTPQGAQSRVWLVICCAPGEARWERGGAERSGCFTLPSAVGTNSSHLRHEEIRPAWLRITLSI